jgi:alcohol dehydrogenase
VHIGRSHIRRDMAAVLDLIATGKLVPDMVTTNAASFADAPEALREHCRTDALKTILLA